MSTAADADIISTFLTPYFGTGYNPAGIGTDERVVLDGVVDYVTEKFSDAKYVLGLAIDFALLAQLLSAHDPDAKTYRKRFDKTQLFARYSLITARGGRTANTLTLQFGAAKYGIRRIEEAVIDLFVSLNRPGYPSAYVYNTGQWRKFEDTLLAPCFSLSESGRFGLCNRLIEFARARLTEGAAIGRATQRVRVFDRILAEYARSGPRENAGTALQGIAFGFVRADRPHLTFVVDKTRTGSARQARIGDIDGYFGLDLEVTCEVKDHALDAANVGREVGEFLAKVRDNKVMGLVFAQTVAPEAAAVLRAAGADCITLAQLGSTVSTWDWRKQDQAVHGFLHYLAHVEQNPDAVRRLLGFIRAIDPTHDALAFDQDASASS